MLYPLSYEGEMWSLRAMSLELLRRQPSVNPGPRADPAPRPEVETVYIVSNILWSNAPARTALGMLCTMGTIKRAPTRSYGAMWTPKLPETLRKRRRRMAVHA